MKAKKIITSMFLIFLVTGMVSIANAQEMQKRRGNRMQKQECVEKGMRHMGILNLTDQQKEDIKKLRLEHIKDMTPLKNKLNENRAKHRTLMSADKVDMNAINKNIDEFTSIKNKMMKLKAKHKQSVRKLLTEEQRIMFDSKAGKMHHRKGRGGMNHPSCSHPKMRHRR
ncbi:MAG: Spy/CpxP family protein refolding chaperone [Bacteroidales bacterium]|jgi:Spy/CpxP family protein refolding chaperone|nr:Spy/CpxP family protein refolding chaperone [Bacteroidales bacterium]